MMEYLVEGKSYILKYSELRDHYHKFVAMTDGEFRRNLPSAIHFACIVCWLKDVGPDASVGDRGVVHMLAHLLDAGEVPGNDTLREVRTKFKRILKLD